MLNLKKTEEFKQKKNENTRRNPNKAFRGLK